MRMQRIIPEWKSYIYCKLHKTINRTKKDGMGEFWGKISKYMENSTTGLQLKEFAPGLLSIINEGRLHLTSVLTWLTICDLRKNFLNSYLFQIAKENLRGYLLRALTPQEVFFPILITCNPTSWFVIVFPVFVLLLLLKREQRSSKNHGKII